MTKRLLPNVVVRSYRRKGVKPGYRFWRRIVGNNVYCCALSARFCKQRELRAEGMAGFARLSMVRAKEYGLSADYIDGYVEGFDSSTGVQRNDFMAGPNKDRRQGFADGYATQKLAKRHFK